MKKDSDFTHIDSSGKARMVDISGKKDSTRTAEAIGTIKLDKDIIKKIRDNDIGKGDVLAVAKIAGISAAKKTWELIPLCHQIRLKRIDIDFNILDGEESIEVKTRVSAYDSTGVEMEAITAASVSLITIYDMCKALSKDMQIGPVCLLSKTGGKSGYIKK
ncbi:MAG: cyclic pyranopterin monophosphate synthase MoaC [Actinomycetia bacterium]|nr:cyclic pyranopterin monophosphate synthase MoaC [Actinomycetes bacterium]